MTFRSIEKQCRLLGNGVLITTIGVIFCSRHVIMSHILFKVIRSYVNMGMNKFSILFQILSCSCILFCEVKHDIKDRIYLPIEKQGKLPCNGVRITTIGVIS